MRRVLARPWTAAVALAAAVIAIAASGCGYDVELPDLFAITRTGEGSTLSLVVNQSGAITCNHGRQKMLTSAQLITARDLSDNLGADATAKLHIPPAPGTVYYYRVRKEQGTIAFPDRAATDHRYLGQLEAFVLQVAPQYCGGRG